MEFEIICIVLFIFSINIDACVDYKNVCFYSVNLRITFNFLYNNQLYFIFLYDISIFTCHSVSYEVYGFLGFRFSWTSNFICEL